MAERLVWHIGLPKTGTSYLQDVIWGNRELLAERGVVMPGFGHRVHLWAALELSGEQGLEKRHAAAPGAWQRMVDQIGAAEGTALLTHEFFSGATAEQAARGRAAFGDTDVHLVITARDAASMLRAGWQEFVKNGGERSLADLSQRTEPHQFSWWSWDLAGVLERWAPIVPPENIHILPMPGAGAAPDQHWRNFAQVLGIDSAVTLPEGTVNASLGVVQIEALRQVNAHLGDFHSHVDRGHWIRGRLAEHHLAAQSSDRLALGEELLAQCEARTDRAWQMIQANGHHLVGDPEDLRTPDSARNGRTVESVTPQEKAEATAELVAGLLGDVRRLTTEAKQAAKLLAAHEEEAAAAAAEAESRTLRGRARGIVRRS